MIRPACWVLGWWLFMSAQASAGDPTDRTIALPAPRLTSEVSLETALNTRESVREYRDDALSLAEVSQLLWAAQGITRRDGGRTSPSAGALYPLEVHLVAGNVDGLNAGVYRYRTRGHEILRVSSGDIRDALARAALGQECIRDGSVVLVISAVYGRTSRKYREDAPRYVHMEAGHAAQNVCLQATALGLGAVPVGAFYEDRVEDILKLPDDESALYLIPLGKLR